MVPNGHAFLLISICLIWCQIVSVFWHIFTGHWPYHMVGNCLGDDAHPVPKCTGLAVGAGETIGAGYFLPHKAETFNLATCSTALDSHASSAIAGILSPRFQSTHHGWIEPSFWMVVRPQLSQHNPCGTRYYLPHQVAARYMVACGDNYVNAQLHHRRRLPRTSGSEIQDAGHAFAPPRACHAGSDDLEMTPLYYRFWSSGHFPI